MAGLEDVKVPPLEGQSLLERAGDLPLYKFLGLSFEKLEADLVVAKMLITDQHVQALGSLHGGVFSILVEGLGSAGALMASPQRAVGLEVSCSHFSEAPVGTCLVATGKPLYGGRTVQVWEVRVEEDIRSQLFESHVDTSEITVKDNKVTKPKEAVLFSIGRIGCFVMGNQQASGKGSLRMEEKRLATPMAVLQTSRLRQTFIEEFLDLRLVVTTEIVVVGRMLVTERCMQPFRALHGGVSALVVEAMGMTGAGLSSPGEPVKGIGVSCRHLRGVPVGTSVIAIAIPRRSGKAVQVWDVRIMEDLHPERAVIADSQADGIVIVEPRDVCRGHQGPLLAAGFYTCIVPVEIADLPTAEHMTKREADNVRPRL